MGGARRRDDPAALTDTERGAIAGPQPRSAAHLALIYPSRTRLFYRIMGLPKLLRSKRTRLLSAASMLLQAARAYTRGKPRLAVLYVAGAAVSYWKSGLGFLAQVLLQLYRRTRTR